MWCVIEKKNIENVNDFTVLELSFDSLNDKAKNFAGLARDLMLFQEFLCCSSFFFQGRWDGKIEDLNNCLDSRNLSLHFVLFFDPDRNCLANLIDAYDDSVSIAYNRLFFPLSYL